MRGSLALLLIGYTALGASAAGRWSYVDDQGVMRWRDDGSEIALFGVNYYTPFSLDYEGLQALGADPRETIERDVAHFARLGLDAIRLHVFDRQISDQQGHLVETEHLELFDYLVAQCKRRGIYVVLTPIAWWPSQSASRGFSSLYTKPQMVLDSRARAAQTAYLRQFMNHVNPHTRLAYQDEPAIVAIELINEPEYSRGTTVAQVAEYARELAAAVRATGARQPIFYNGWAGMEEAIPSAGIEGCTFGWYPMGLVSGACLRGNYLPAVDDYPQMRLPCLAKKAKIVYEFDAADVPGRVMYPAMARAFRSGGAQIATQFQYDPLPLAYCNYSWQTHYLNLVFAPGKTVSFAIAAEAFRQIPRLARFGRYPENTTFGPARVDYSRDVSTLATDKLFYYSNNTDASPPSPERLERIIGCGSSPLIQYAGTGAYLLDRLSDGVWRLEVYPDAVWIADPHGRTSLDREVSRLVWASHAMTLRLPGLGADFRARRVLPEPGPVQQATAATVRIEPGAYLVAKRDADIGQHVDTGFYAPKPRSTDVAAWWQSPNRWRAGHDLPIRAMVAATDIREVTCQFRAADGKIQSLPISPADAYTYEGRVPGGTLTAGKLLGRLEVRSAKGVHWLPRGSERWSETPKPCLLWEVAKDTPAPELDQAGTGGYACRASLTPGPALRLWSAGFGEPPCAAGCRLPLRAPEQGAYDTICIRTRATEPDTDQFELGLAQRDGRAYGFAVPVWQDWQDARVPIRALRPLWGTPDGTLDVTQLKELSLVFGAWLYGDRRQRPHGFEIQRVWLEQALPGWEIDVAAATAPVEVFHVDDRPLTLQGQADKSMAIVRGSAPGRRAWRVWTRGFGPAPDCIGFRRDAPEEIGPLREALKACDTIRIVARATQPATHSLELVLIEQDSTPWGTVVPLRTEWQEVLVKTDQLKFFSHWSHPANRGVAGDRFQPGNVAAVSFCFGAWLFGEHAAEPHGIEVESVSLVTTGRQPGH